MIIACSFLFCSSIVLAIPWRAVNLATNDVFEYDTTGAAPTEIERVRLKITAVDTRGASGDVAVHIVRLRWTEPVRWNDEKAGGGEVERVERREYDVVCELADTNTGQSQHLVDRSVSSDITALAERFTLPSSHLTIICAVRATNKYGRKGAWKYSRMVSIDGSKEQIDMTSSSTDGMEELPGDIGAIPVDMDDEPAEIIEVNTTRKEINYKDQTTKIEHTTFTKDQLLEMLHASQLEELPPLLKSEEFQKKKQPVVVVLASIKEQATPEPVMKTQSVSRDSDFGRTFEAMLGEIQKVEQEIPSKVQTTGEDTLDDIEESRPPPKDYEDFGKGTTSSVEQETVTTMTTSSSKAEETTDETKTSIDEETTPISSVETEFDVTNKAVTTLDHTAEMSIEDQTTRIPREDQTTPSSVEDSSTLLDTTRSSESQKDIFFSSPRGNWEPSATKGGVVESQTESNTEHQTEADYDNLESQLREALGADDSAVDRLNELLQFGVHDRLL